MVRVVDRIPQDSILAEKQDVPFRRGIPSGVFGCPTTDFVDLHDRLGIDEVGGNARDRSKQEESAEHLEERRRGVTDDDPRKRHGERQDDDGDRHSVDLRQDLGAQGNELHGASYGIWRGGRQVVVLC